ncbi:MAG: YdbC family protein [Eubacteriales bacterium]
MQKSNKAGDNQDKVVYKVIRKLGVVAEYPNGWTKEVNLISWNDKEPKVDLRDWDEKHEHMSRGITLKVEETAKVVDILEAFLLAEGEKASA